MMASSANKWHAGQGKVKNNARPERNNRRQSRYSGVVILDGNRERLPYDAANKLVQLVFLLRRAPVAVHRTAAVIA